VFKAKFREQWDAAFVDMTVVITEEKPKKRSFFSRIFRE